MRFVTETWKEAVAKWKADKTVWTAELGGMGPGYEQAIQVLLWEILARWPNDDLGELAPNDHNYPDDYERHVEEIVSDLDQAVGGFSGAQVGAAKSTAYQFLRYGYAEMMNKLPAERRIMVQKWFPKFP